MKTLVWCRHVDALHDCEECAAEARSAPYTFVYRDALLKLADDFESGINGGFALLAQEVRNRVAAADSAVGVACVCAQGPYLGTQPVGSPTKCQRCKGLVVARSER